MSAAAPKAKFRRDRDKERKEKQQPLSERLKTVVRRLPPNLPEDVFWMSVEKWVTTETVTWKVFYPGKPGKRLNKEFIPARAYIAFKSEEQVLRFSREYDGHTFRDKAGHESRAIVEFAPYQKVPSEKKKSDARNATIEKDEDYISFLTTLNASSTPETMSLEELIAASQPPPQPTTTPLLEALKAEKLAMKDKEAILRNHAHHKETIILTPSRKEDPRKKPAPTPRVSEPSSIGKKAGKKVATTATTTPSIVQKLPAPAHIAPKNPVAVSNSVGKSTRPIKVKAAPPKIMQAPPKVVPATTGTTPSADVPSTSSTPAAAPNLASHEAASANHRRRPVIGLASRHFEAALSGAGVSAAGRRSRKGSEPAAEKEALPPASGTSSAAITEAKSTPSSPKRDRGRYTSDSSTAETSTGPKAAPPASAPRIDSAPSEGEVGTLPSQVSKPAAHIHFTGGRGGRRGRGRGRGGGIPTRGG